MPSLRLPPDVLFNVPDIQTIPTPSKRLPCIVNGTLCQEYYDFETGPRDMAMFLCGFLLSVMIFVGLLWSLRNCVRRLRCPYSVRESTLDAAERGEADSLAPHEDFTLAPNALWWEVVVKREAQDPTFGRDLVVAPEYVVEDEILRFDPDYCLKSGALWWEVVEAQEKAGS